MERLMEHKTEQPLGVVTEPGTVRLERNLPGPIDRVWEYLTVSEKRGKWLATGEIEQRVGGLVNLHWRHADLSPVKEAIPARYGDMEQGHHMEGAVTACNPPHLLSFTWGEPPTPSEVTFELTEQGERVLLVVTHRHLPNREAMVSVGGGWHTHLGILIDHLHGAEPRPFWSSHAAMEAEYQKIIA
jgi:uncharacterized protein YndB with AHSA1/START domain